MTYTFAEAKTRLAQFASAYGLVDLSATVNEALDELSRTRAWKRMTKLVRFTVTSEYFALPQDCGALRRVAIDSLPVRVYGSDYEFISAGFGDLDYAFEGYAPLHGVQRLGIYPTMYGLSAASTLAAFSTSVPSGAIKAKVRLSGGDIANITIPCTAWAGTSDEDGLTSSVTATAESVEEILGITLPHGVSDYISLYAVADGAVSFVSRMHPSVRVPEFTRYRMAGFSAETDASYRMLAEVGLRFAPLVADDDIIPFASLRPIQYMLQSHWAMDAGEIKQADEFRKRAELSMVMGDAYEDERQSIVVVNALYEGSNGEASVGWENV